VITPFRSATDDALLLVNRGWVQKSGPAGDAPSIITDTEFKTVQGLVGRLPRVGIRPGEAFEGPREWPRVGVYPTLNEVAAELGEPVLPVVLLLRPEADYGFVRHWEPNISGPMTHYSYAFQWFAMAAAVIVIAAWHMTKRFRRDPGKA
jgi:cytochrome oxidase assembly protein ShyY1